MAQLRFVEMPNGANHVSLVSAQVNFQNFGAATRREAGRGREPVPGERRDDQWRPVDPTSDNIEQPAAGIDYANSYPEDTTVLYYWRTTYWRRLVS